MTKPSGMYLDAALHGCSTEGSAVQDNICQKEYYQQFKTDLYGAKCSSTNGCGLSSVKPTAVLIVLFKYLHAQLLPLHFCTAVYTLLSTTVNESVCYNIMATDTQQ